MPKKDSIQTLLADKDSTELIIGALYLLLVSSNSESRKASMFFKGHADGRVDPDKIDEVLMSWMFAVHREENSNPGFVLTELVKEKFYE